MTDPPIETPADVASEIQTLVSEADARRKTATLLGPLAKQATYDDLGRLGKAIEAARKKLAGLGDRAAIGAAILDRVEAGFERRQTALRERLGPDLKAACQGVGLTMRVVDKEGPIRLRIPPFGVVVDRDKGKARIEFGQEPLEEASAEADAIVAAHQRALRAMGTFDAAGFFTAALRAWQAAVALGHGGAGDRVEIATVLPYLALEMQSQRFRKSPSRSSFTDYSRAHFAYDVMRLREERALSQGGWRLNLGVATGTSASANKKSRVVWIEDANGDGEYKLTIYFQRIDRS